MMRYRGKFQRSKYPVTAVDVTDEGEVLEQKWKHWVEMEQWKRYVLVIPHVERRHLTDGTGSCFIVIYARLRRP